MTTDIVPVDNMAALDTLDAQAREVAITSMLDQARTWLAHAVESTAPAQDIANFKAFVATAAETARRLKVSKEIQVDAEVMVRRSERALGQAIRGGQERGEIRTRGERETVANQYASAVPSINQNSTSAPTDFAASHELYGNGAGIYDMTDDVTDAEFDEALTRAQDEQNVSRANVVRKVREVQSGAEVQQAKWARVTEMAERGYTSPQIAREVGMTEEGLRAGARREGIDIRADRIVGNARRLDMRRVISQTVADLDAMAVTTGSLITTDGILAARIEVEEIQEWVDSLNQSLAALRKATNQIAKAANQIKESKS